MNIGHRPQSIRTAAHCKLVASGLAALALFGAGSFRSYSQGDSARLELADTLTHQERQEQAMRSPITLGHPDLGEINLVQRQPPPKLLTLQTNQLFSYTSNAFLRPEDEHGSFLWNGRIAALLVPYATRSFTPTFSFEQNFFRFERFTTLDFDTQTAAVTIKLDLTKDGRWSTVTSAAFNRLFTSRFDAGDFYNYALFSESVSYIRQLGNSPIYSGTTLGANWRLGNPSTFDRYAFFLNEAAIFSATPTLQIAAFVRPELHVFTNHDGGPDHHGAEPSLERDKSPKDFNLSAGTSITWTPVKECSISANFLWTRNWSTFGPHEYNVFTPSVGLTATIAF